MIWFYTYISTDLVHPCVYVDEGGEEVVRQVQVKKPALHFMDQLTEYVENIYNFICDDMIKELQPLLASSIEVVQLGFFHT